MADLSDVENVLVSQVLNALYPRGISHPSAIGVACRIYRGWPSPAALNSDLAAGTVNVTVFPATTPGEILEPYFEEEVPNIASITLGASVSGNVVTISGSVAEGLIVGILLDGDPISYKVTEGDTLDSVAANLMTLVSANRIAILSGSAIAIPNAKNLIARVTSYASVSKGLRRQRREIRICFWCPSPGIRDSACSTADIALTAKVFFDLPDGTKTHVQYASTEVYDQSQSALLYRRDLCYRCEFTTIRSFAAPIMLFGDLIDNGKPRFV